MTFHVAALSATLPHPSHRFMLLGINERLRPLTGGQPLAEQMRSRRICHSLSVALHLEIH
ncbi:hypothetical protein FE393_01120 [Xenorhabdus sp. psl]|nr:hypothetical protein [Xenorhabdus sp. psl]